MKLWIWFEHWNQTVVVQNATVEVIWLITQNVVPSWKANKAKHFWKHISTTALVCKKSGFCAKYVPINKEWETNCQNHNCFLLICSLKMKCELEIWRKFKLDFLVKGLCQISISFIVVFIPLWSRYWDFSNVQKDVETFYKEVLKRF